MFDQSVQMKSSYPTYSQPYSHDISALTNAHRNQVDNHRPPYYNDGAETYRKYNDDSSGYRSIPSPRKTSDSPPRVHGGDNSMARKLNQGTSRPGDEQSEPNGYSSPSHRQSHPPHRGSPQKLHRTDSSDPLSPRSEQQQQSYGDPNSTTSPRALYEGGRNGHSPTRRAPDEVTSNVSMNGVRDSRLEEAAGPEASQTYGRETDDREMMSATPTNAAAAAAQGYNSEDHPSKVNKSVHPSLAIHEEG